MESKNLAIGDNIALHLVVMRSFHAQSAPTLPSICVIGAPMKAADYRMTGTASPSPACGER